LFGWGAAPGDSTQLRRLFADHLLDAKYEKSCEAIQELADRGVGDAVTLLNIVAPKWVKPEHASPLEPLALLPDAPRLALLDSEDPWTAESYISRAWNKPLKNPGRIVCTVEPPDGRRPSILDIVGQIKRRHKDLARFVLKSCAKPQPIILIFPPESPPDPKLLDALSEELPSSMVVFLNRGQTIRPEVARGPTALPLDYEVESAASISYGKVCCVLYGGAGHEQ
jgi:hypothetical protein